MYHQQLQRVVPLQSTVSTLWRLKIQIIASFIVQKKAFFSKHFINYLE